jgi:hypothetical protein
MKDVFLKVLNKHDFSEEGTEPFISELAETMTTFGEWCIQDSYEFFESGTTEKGNYYFDLNKDEDTTFNNIFLYWYKNIWKK